MAIHVLHLERLRRLAEDAHRARLDGTYSPACSRCAELSAAVRRLADEVDELRAPYARAFRDGASEALEFAARTLDGTANEEAASIVRRLRAVVRE